MDRRLSSVSSSFSCRCGKGVKNVETFSVREESERCHVWNGDAHTYVHGCALHVYSWFTILSTERSDGQQSTTLPSLTQGLTVLSTCERVFSQRNVPVRDEK